MKKIVVTGSLAFDYIMDFPETYEEHILPEKLKTLSVSFRMQKLNKNFGGVAGNIAYTLSLFNQPAIILASAGDNDFAPYQKHLIRQKINTSTINIVKNEFTANAFIMTDKNNCQITGFYPGALSSDKLLSLGACKNIDFVILGPTDTEAMVRFVKEAKEKNIPYLYNPVQHIPELSGFQLKEAIQGAEILIGNDYEIALILKKTGFVKNDLLQKARIVVTTLGEKGSLIETAKEKVTVGIAKSVNVVDPTGAGDAYIAGFTAGYLRKFPLQTCGQMGAAAAVYAIENYGTQNHKFSAFDFQKRYQQSFGNMIQWAV